MPAGVRGPQLVRVGEVGALLGGTALLAGSWIVVARHDEVPALEARVFERINGLPGSVWPLAWVPMQAGSFVGSLAVAAATLSISGDRRLGAATLLAAQSTYWGAKLVKKIVLRGRPNVLLVDVHLRENAKGLGYVSGHSGVAVAMAAALVPSLPRLWRPAALAVPVIVGFARMYSGAHLPLDVVGGAGVGLLAGALARRVLQPARAHA
jgi:membrane-associated phospholipid phosphatase